MVAHIRPTQFNHWVDSVQAQGQPVLLDVREPFEVALARVAPEGCETVHIPMGVVPPRLSELDPNRPLACLCHHGGRSMQVALFLKARGFAQVVNVQGGIDAWAADVDSSVPRY